MITKRSCEKKAVKTFAIRRVRYSKKGAHITLILHKIIKVVIVIVIKKRRHGGVGVLYITYWLFPALHTEFSWVFQHIVFHLMWQQAAAHSANAFSPAVCHGCCVATFFICLSLSTSCHNWRQFVIPVPHVHFPSRRLQAARYIWACCSSLFWFVASLDGWHALQIVASCIQLKLQELPLVGLN